MNPKFRVLYLSIGFIGLAILIYDAIATFPDINEKVVLLITIPDMVFFFMAYKTYPPEINNSYKQRKSRNS